MTLEEYKKAVMALRDSHNNPLQFNTRTTANRNLLEISLLHGDKLISIDSMNNLKVYIELDNPNISNAIANILWEETMDYLKTPYENRGINSNIHQVPISYDGGELY